MSWQVQRHFCKMMRCCDSFEKYYTDETKRCGIEMLYDNFKINGSILKYINNTNMYAKSIYNNGIVMY